MMLVRIFAVAVVALAAAASTVLPKPGDAIFAENFDSLSATRPLAEQTGWKVFHGFPGKSPPQVKVVSRSGVDGSAALAVWHDSGFRGDNFGVQIPLPGELKNGVVWMQCRVKAPRLWQAAIFFDARGPREVVARIAGERLDAKDEPKDQIRWHASWERSYWRLYTKTDLKSDHWFTLTARLDLDRGSYAAWVDDQVLGEDLRLCGPLPITHLFISCGGTKEDPAYIDNVTVTREAPAGRALRAFLPQPKDGLLFRFATVGDPQIGFSSYETDTKRFEQTVEQINESGAEFTLVLGDMVHNDKDEKSYKDLKQLADRLKNPCHFVRGNHETKELYQRYFNPKLDDAFTHKGWRFVMIDAEGNHTGLSKEQLDWIAGQFRQADDQGEEIVACMHVSPWQENERGRSMYNQIGPGRDELRALMAKHKVLLSMSGHYHRGLWHAKEEQTNYLVLGGTAVVRFGLTGWCVCDVYGDRIEIHQKPVFFAYERPGEERFYHLPYLRWEDYATCRKQHPYLQHGPLVIPRHRPR